MKKEIIAFVTVLVVIYLGGAFASASFNINEWDVFLRGFIALFAIALGAIAAGIVCGIKTT